MCYSHKCANIHKQAYTHTQTSGKRTYMQTDRHFCGSHEKFNFHTLLVHTWKCQRRKTETKNRTESTDKPKRAPTRKLHAPIPNPTHPPPPPPTHQHAQSQFNVCVILKQCENCAYAQLYHLARIVPWASKPSL